MRENDRLRYTSPSTSTTDRVSKTDSKCPPHTKKNNEKTDRCKPSRLPARKQLGQRSEKPVRARRGDTQPTSCAFLLTELWTQAQSTSFLCDSFDFPLLNIRLRLCIRHSLQDRRLTMEFRSDSKSRLNGLSNGTSIPSEWTWEAKSRACQPLQSTVMLSCFELSRYDFASTGSTAPLLLCASYNNLPVKLISVQGSKNLYGLQASHAPCLLDLGEI